MNINFLDLPTGYTSERLLLRRYHPGDITMYYQMLGDNAEHLYEFLPSFLENMRGEEDVKTWFDKLSSASSKKRWHAG
jgi:RimJ/RimL family protein N-acetyltransferase